MAQKGLFAAIDTVEVFRDRLKASYDVTTPIARAGS